MKDKFLNLLRPDQKEINLALEQFDEMLNNFEIYDNNTDFSQQNKLSPNSNITRSPSFQLSPSAVYSIVHNNNNKYDNTLKKRNALVAFEFKKLVSRYNHDVTHDEIRNNNSRGSTSESRSVSSNCSSNEGVNENIHSIQQQKPNLKNNLPLNKNLNNLLSTSLTNLNNNNINGQVHVVSSKYKSSNFDLTGVDQNNKNRKLSNIGMLRFETIVF